MARKSKTRSFKDLRNFVAQRSVLKRDTFELGKVRFAEVKTVLGGIMTRLSADTKVTDPRLEVRFVERNDYECASIIAGDYLLFHLHTNVFRLDVAEGESPTNDYLKENPDRAYCAVIHVYNFLADSFRYERSNDAGYLVARIFLNAENHFFVEGISDLSTTFNHFPTAVFDGKSIEQVLVAVIYEALNFELLAPEFVQISEVVLTDAIRGSGLTGYRTGKKMGFRLSHEAKEDTH